MAARWSTVVAWSTRTAGSTSRPRGKRWAGGCTACPGSSRCSTCRRASWGHRCGWTRRPSTSPGTCTSGRSHRRPTPHSSSRWWRSCGARGSTLRVPRGRCGSCPGSTGGRVGVLLKVHHVVADGVGGMALLGALLDREMTGEPRPSGRPPASPPSTSALLRDQLRRLRASGRAVSALAHPVALVARDESGVAGDARARRRPADAADEPGSRRRDGAPAAASSAAASTWCATSRTRTVRR